MEVLRTASEEASSGSVDWPSKWVRIVTIPGVDRDSLIERNRFNFRSPDLCQITAAIAVSFQLFENYHFPL